MAPFRHLFAFARRLLQIITLFMAASIQYAQPWSLGGVSESPAQAWSRAALLFSSSNKEVSK